MSQKDKTYSKYRKAKRITKRKILYSWGESLGIFFWNFLVSALISVLGLLGLTSYFIYAAFQAIRSGEVNLPTLFYYSVPVALVMLILPLLPYFMLWRKIRKQYKNALDLSHLEELPLKMSGLIKARIDTLSERMPESYQKRLFSHPIKFLYEKRNFTALPSMVFADKTINLIIPLGFLKTIKSNPSGADAILAHELGHFFHNDSNLLLKIRCYYQISDQWKRYIPFLVLGSMYLSLVIGQTNPRVWYFLPFIFISEIFLRFRAYKFVLQGVYERVLDAERLADLFAATITSTADIKHFLKDNIDHSHAWYSLHPSLASRINNINDFEESVSK